MIKLDDSLAKIAAGSMIGLVGYVAGLGFIFLGRLLVARLGGEADYGVFSIAFVVLHIAVFIGTLGLDAGVSRNIAFTRSNLFSY